MNEIIKHKKAHTKNPLREPDEPDNLGQDCFLLNLFINIIL